nr:hypothetical protein [Akkermansiaceae bacterium]
MKSSKENPGPDSRYHPFPVGAPSHHSTAAYPCRAAVRACSLLFASATALQAVTPVPLEIISEQIPGAKPRNVVFILSDDHRYDAMSFL